jgi:Protein of unknown function (DUF3500)
MISNSSPRWYRTIALFTAILLQFAVQAMAVSAHDVPAEMAEAANRFLKSLEDQKSQQVSSDFASGRRTAWHFFPSSMLESQGGRRGLAVKEMSAQQRALAQGLLNTALSHQGYFQAMTIIALETILHDLEDGNPMRDSEMYHVAIFGTPSTGKTWGWSFEGHHLSVNLTLVEGQKICVTPSFFGSNPAIVQSGPFQGLDTLAPEQQLARDLVRAFTPEQRKLAVIAAQAPPDIITAAQREVAADQFQPPQGIPIEKLNANQRKLLLELVGHFTRKYRAQILDQINRRTPILEDHGITFAWAGGMEPGEGHYYRIQTPHFLFEYDNSQNKANHIHTVWRQFDGDFGADLLRQHYQTAPHHAE